jgi:hypothetical protein
MKTVSSIVENYIKTKPFFIECFIFRQSIWRHFRNIMSELESEFGKEVKQGAGN